MMQRNRPRLARILQELFHDVSIFNSEVDIRLAIDFEQN